MHTFTLDGKQYQICDNGGFRIQIGKHDKLGHPRYKTQHRFEGITSFTQAMRMYSGYNIGPGYTKRLSYNTSRNAPYYELHKVRG